MLTAKELFAMTNEALVEAWRAAKLEDLETRMHHAIAAAKIAEEHKLAAEMIGLVISFRLGREISTPPDQDFAGAYQWSNQEKDEA